MKRADPLIKKGDVAGYLAALEKSLRAYWAAKTSTAAASLTWEEMAGVLGEKCAAPEVEGRLHDLWEGLQRARYTPGLVTPEEARNRAASFEKLLPELEALW